MSAHDLAELLISEPIEAFHSDREFALLLDQVQQLGLVWECRHGRYGHGLFECTLRPEKPGNMIGARWRREAPQAWGSGMTPVAATSEALGHAIQRRIYRWGNE